MIAAMMLPTMLPLLALFRRIVGGRRDAGALVAAVAAGYALAWLAFGVVAYGIDSAVREAAATSGWLIAHGWVVGSVVIAGAGAFQFSALKYRCLERCRSPVRLRQLALARAPAARREPSPGPRPRRCSASAAAGR